MIIPIVVGVLTIYTLFDVIATPRGTARKMSRALWAIVVFVPVVGPVLWLTIGRPRRRRPAAPPRRVQPPVTGPDDDPDFLRNLDPKPEPSFNEWEEELKRKKRSRERPHDNE